MNLFNYIHMLEAIIQSLLKEREQWTQSNDIPGLTFKNNPVTYSKTHILECIKDWQPELELRERIANIENKMRLPWDCPESPDKYCHYGNEIENGKLKLINDKIIDMNSDEFDSEYCLFCGEPEERK